LHAPYGHILAGETQQAGQQNWPPPPPPPSPPQPLSNEPPKQDDPIWGDVARKHFEFKAEAIMLQMRTWERRSRTVPRAAAPAGVMRVEGSGHLTMGETVVRLEQLLKEHGFLA
jgi:hypothetical protein